MAKVGNIILKIRGRSEKYDIHYTQKTLFEIRGIPEEVLRLTETIPLRYVTEEELVDTIKAAIIKYHALIVSEKKVIAYRIMLPTSFRMTRLARGHWQGGNEMIPDNLKGKISGSSFDTDALDVNFGFMIEYEVFMEIEDNGKKYYSLNDHGEKDRERHLNKCHTVIDYSEKKHEFFQSLQLSTKSMVEKLLNFLGQDEEVLLSIMESGGQKLLG